MNLQTAIFLIVSAICLGIAIGGYVASYLQGKKHDESVLESQPGDLIRLQKDPDNGALEVVVGGQAFRSVAEMNSVQRTLAGYAAHDLQAWLSPQAATGQPAANLNLTAPDTVTTEPQVDAPSTTTAVATVVAAGVSITTQPVVSSSVQERSADGENAMIDDPKKRKRGGFIGVITRALNADVPSIRPVPKSIAVQVNEILQQKLKDTPLESRGICLMELPGQEMVVMIGLDKFDSVGAVPDEEIRAVLQLAVNDWLARSTP
jgi:hypothetical protein